jgi:hypothetical protein
VTYGFRPEHWPTFEHELRVRGIVAGDIERVEIRPSTPAAGVVTVTLTLRSGRVESWQQPEREPAA